jgi:hypothetical protein
MKIQNKRSEQGSVLLIALILSAIMGITLASYLIMTQAQNVSVARSQTWNAAMAVTEAGVEDGLALINKYNSDFYLLTNWMNTASYDNYEVLPNGQYYAKRYVDSNNWGTNYYEVFITPNGGTNPTVTAVGYMAWKYLASTFSPSYFAAAGVASSPSLQTAKRQISVHTRIDPLFAVAMAATDRIDLNGNNITTDSFNSTDPAHSIGGLYPEGQISMVLSNGDICTDLAIVNSISVGNANIKGKAKTGPGGTVSIGPGGYVTGGTYDDFNVQFPPVSLPLDFGSNPWTIVGSTPITVNGKTYDHAILLSGDYVINYTLTKSLFINTNVNARLVIVQNVSQTGNDEIYIATGARLKIYMYGISFSAGGNGIVNENGNAASFAYYGLPSNRAVFFGGNGDFTGTVYAPQADFYMGGGGSTPLDFTGASVTRTVTMRGHFNFHYDEALRFGGPGRGYIPTGWRES